MGIDFYPDYVDYRGRNYVDSVVKFSTSSVAFRSKTIDGEEGSFHINLEIEDIIKIETQWSGRSEMGTMNIYFISKGEAQDNNVHSASGLEELKFFTIDPDWYEKQEAIESLDIRYKALWNVLLDTGMQKCSSLSEEETMFIRRYFPKFDKPFEEVIYPKGDPDAVSISKRDVDLLLPDTFVNDTIIDFYIKYLKTRLNVEERTKCHFFNCFFFRKLADMDKDPSSAFDGKAAFQRVRKWTRKINLLEKDFIFIPVNYNYHWSLLVICYFGEVDSYKDVAGSQSVRVPCILHMDSLRGNHVGLKDLMQSYLWEEWKERRKGTSEDLYSKFRNLKFITLELPQQQNFYDCGLFLLHYVELFLEEVPADFSIYKITPSSTFLQSDWFPPGEASMKRSHIEKLISGLLDIHSEDCPPSDWINDVHCSPAEPKTIQNYGNNNELSVKSGPLNGCRESSLCEEGGHAIKMTLLPSSSIRDSECTRDSELVLKELFKQASASESFTRAPWGGLETSVSLHEFKRPLPLIEEEGEPSECFVPTELAEPVFQNLDSITPEEPILQYSSQDFRLESIHQPTSEDMVDSSPVTSGCVSDDILEVAAAEKWQPVESISFEDEMHKHRCTSQENTDQLTDSFAFSSEQLLNTKENHSPIDISNRIGESFFCDEVAQLHDPDYLAVGPAFTSGDKSDVPECEDKPNAAKRIRIMPPDGEGGHNCSLSEDLHL